LDEIAGDGFSSDYFILFAQMPSFFYKIFLIFRGEVRVLHIIEMLKVKEYYIPHVPELFDMVQNVLSFSVRK